MIPSAGLWGKLWHIQLRRTKDGQKRKSFWNGPWGFLCSYTHANGSSSEEQLVATIIPKLLLHAASVHGAHPWHTQVGLLNTGAACNKQAFLKWGGPFKYVIPTSVCWTFCLVMGWPQLVGKLPPSHSKTRRHTFFSFLGWQLELKIYSGNTQSYTTDLCIKLPMPLGTKISGNLYYLLFVGNIAAQYLPSLLLIHQEN